MGGLYDNNSYINYNDSMNVVLSTGCAARLAPGSPFPPPGTARGFHVHPGIPPGLRRSTIEPPPGHRPEARGGSEGSPPSGFLLILFT